MYAIYNKETKIIRAMIDTTEDRINGYLKDKETYKEFLFSSRAKAGENIDIYTNEGTRRPNSELLADSLITLREDQILEGEVIRTLTQDELKEKFPDRYPEEVTITKEKTISELIAEKESEVKDLKDQYLDADLDDDEPLKLSLKAQIQVVKQEIALLKENVDKE